MAAEDVECRADGEVHTAVADLVHEAEVVDRTGAAGIGGRDGGVLGEQRDEIEVDALRETFHIHSVDQELGAMLGQYLQRGGVHAQIGEGLPAVAHHPVRPLAPAAGEVEHHTFVAYIRGERAETPDVERSVPEQPRRHDHV